MSKYELMYIIDPTLEESTRKELVEKFTKLLVDLGSQVDKVDEWGKRRLAYSIDYKNEGYYVLITFSAEASVPREVERNLQNSESILRYLVVKLEQKRSSVKPRAISARPAPVAAPAPVEEPAEEAPATTEA